VSSLARDPFEPHTLYAGAGAFADSGRRGIYRSSDQGRNWQHIEATASAGLTFRKYRTKDAIAPDPQREGTIVAGSRADGLWRTTNGGTTWQQVHQPPTTTATLFNDGTVEDDPAAPAPAPVSAVVFSPQTSALVWAAYNGYGVFRSNARGAVASWQATTSGLPTTVTDLTVISNGALLAATGPNGVFRSTDGGVSWQAINNGLSFGDEDWVTSVLGHPSNPAVAYATLWTYDVSAVWRTRDSGASWQPLHQVNASGEISNLSRDPFANPTGLWTGTYPEPAQRLAINPFDDDQLLLATYWSIYGSDDGGASWSERVVGAQGTCVTTITAAPDGVLYAAHMDAGLLRSSDQGASWQAVFPTEYDEQAMGHVWNIAVANEGGTTYYFATSDPWSTDSSQVLRSTNGSSWTRVHSRNRPAGQWMGGAMLGLAIDPSDPARLYVSQDGGVIEVSSNYGSSWQQTPAQPGGDSFSYALVVDGHGDVYAGTMFDGLWRSQNRGSSWQRVLTSRSTIPRVVAAGGVVYAAAGDGNLWSSSDRGATWQPLTDLAPTDWGDEVNDQGWSVAVDPTDPQHIVFGLQDSYHPVDASSGLLESRDGGLSWTSINDGLGVADATTLAFGPDGTLYAGTWCGGIWRRAP
jgi:hypothetical protein